MKDKNKKQEKESNSDLLTLNDYEPLELNDNMDANFDLSVFDEVDIFHIDDKDIKLNLDDATEKD